MSALFTFIGLQMNPVAEYHLPLIKVAHPDPAHIDGYKEWARCTLQDYRKKHPKLHKALIDWAGGLKELVVIVTFLRACRCLRGVKPPVLLASWRAVRTAHPKLSDIV